MLDLKKFESHRVFGSPDDGPNKHFIVWDEFSIYQGKQRYTDLFKIGRKPKKSAKAYVNPIKVALKYKQMLGSVQSKAELAQKLGVSRAKVTQMLNLLKLDEEVKLFMLALDDADERLKVLTERRLREWERLSLIQLQEYLRNIY